MAEVQLKNVKVKHDAIMDFMLANPTMQMGDVAAVFGVSRSWLSIIINSDAFQQQLSVKQRTLFGETIVPLREKVLGVAHLGVEKLGEALDNASAVTDKGFIADTTDMLLKGLGYSPKSAPAAPVVQQNFVVADKGTLEAARVKMRQAANAVEGEVIEQTQDRPPAEGLQDSGGSGVGEVLPNAPTVRQAEAIEGEKG